MHTSSLLAAFLLACPLFAQPALAADWSGQAGLVSDYRYRGVSLSEGRPALQTSIEAEIESGPYFGAWASTLGGKVSPRIEGDLTAGFTMDVAKTITLDLSATYYVYPGSSSENALELTALLEATHGPLTLSGGGSFAPPQPGTRDDSGRKAANFYAFANASYAVPGLPVTLQAGAGHERGAWDGRRHGGKWDWSLGAAAGFGRMRMSLDAVGSNAAKGTLVGSLLLTF